MVPLEHQLCSYQELHNHAQHQCFMAHFQLIFVHGIKNKLQVWLFECMVWPARSNPIGPQNTIKLALIKALGRNINTCLQLYNIYCINIIVYAIVLLQVHVLVAVKLH